MTGKRQEFRITAQFEVQKDNLDLQLISYQLIAVTQNILFLRKTITSFRRSTAAFPSPRPSKNAFLNSLKSIDLAKENMR